MKATMEENKKVLFPAHTGKSQFNRTLWAMVRTGWWESCPDPGKWYYHKGKLVATIFWNTRKIVFHKCN